MRHIDADLGRPLPEKSYGGNCLIYDKDVPEDPYHNFWVLMHIILFFLYINIDNIWKIILRSSVNQAPGH